MAISKCQKKDGQARIKSRKLSFENEVKIVPEEQKLSNFIAKRPALQEMLKGVLKAEMKGHWVAT